MTLDDAVKEFQALFDVVEVGKPDKTLPIVCSGGMCSQEQPAPALFSEEERAITAWLETARKEVPLGSKKLEWLRKPEVIKYQITMADIRQRHRVAGDRFTVKSQFVARPKDGV